MMFPTFSEGTLGSRVNKCDIFMSQYMSHTIRMRPWMPLESGSNPMPAVPCSQATTTCAKGQGHPLYLARCCLSAQEPGKQQAEIPVDQLLSLIKLTWQLELPFG